VLVFFGRTYASDNPRRPPYEFNEEQKRAWEALEDRLHARVAEACGYRRVQGTGDASAPSLSPLEAACLRVCIALLDHKVQLHEYESPLVYASALLGLATDG